MGGFTPFGPLGPTGAAGGDLSGTYPNPTVKQSSVAIFEVLNALNVGGNMAGASLNVAGTSVLGAIQNFGQIAYQPGFDAGINSSGNAPVLTALGSTAGTSKQLSDTARDYIVYLECTTGGTVTTISMGHTIAANDVTILSSVSVVAGSLYSFRLPAGWWFEWTGTTTAFGNQNAVGC